MSKINKNINFVQWLALLMICLASTSAEKPCNDFLDAVLKHMKSEKEFFQEPYEIPENQKKFAIYELEHGQVFGLNTLHRTDDVIMRKNGNDKYIRVHFGAGVLQLQSTIKKKYLSFGKTSNVDATVPFVTMELDIMPIPDSVELVIRNFKVDEMKGLKLKFSGGGKIKDFSKNAFAGAFGRFFKNTVKNSLEDSISRFLKNKKTQLPIPPACLNDIWNE